MPMAKPEKNPTRAIGVAVADVEVGDVVADADADADELELVVLGEEIEEEEVAVVEEVDAVIEDVARIHWSLWQL
ncbi:hypothetical protein HO133_008515 [Letharia lupina]|uniref:Uncharacterized protein n=1 Tax=Letharia lupina TaxID=560253 RepID=A0A8H6FGK5_9LECA|nr:uncharacterized protein HO133_008515 [Letharia lupina]KAF6227074.1 hypothetical protein HO133_008515 [Letharia lupina]